MHKRLIWVEGEDFTGWCCSYCTWGIAAPHLESTVAALAFNRLAQDTFESTPVPTAHAGRRIARTHLSRLAALSQVQAPERSQNPRETHLIGRLGRMLRDCDGCFGP